MPSCNGTDTGCNITRRESGLTSLRCLDTRTPEESTQKVLQMSVALCHWCYLPRKGIDFCLVSCSQQVSYCLRVLHTAFEMLEPDEGKLCAAGRGAESLT